jgi:hypothetical protein
MSEAHRVIVRHRNGSTTHYDIGNALDWAEARAFVLEQVPSARAVLVLVKCGRPLAVPGLRDAA